MNRWLLNTFPLGALVPLVVVVVVGVALGGYAAVRRLLPSWEDRSEQRELSAAFAISAGLFSFVLAFTIGQLYTNFTRAEDNAKLEAARVGQVLRVAEGLRPPLATVVIRETLAYAAEVHDHEWRLMSKGRTSVAAWRDVDRIYATLEAARRRAGADPFFGQTLARLDDMVAARQARLDSVNLSLTPLFQVLLLVGALLTIFGTFSFKPLGERIQVAMIGGAAALIALSLLVAISLDYPYSGSVAVSSAPFEPATLAQLAGVPADVK